MCYNNDNDNHNEWTMINKRKKKLQVISFGRNVAFAMGE